MMPRETHDIARTISAPLLAAETMRPSWSDLCYSALDRRLFLALGLAGIYGCATPLFRGQSPDLEAAAEEEKKPEPPPPPPPKQEPPKVEMTKFTPPKIVKDEEVKKEEIPPEVKELEDTKIDVQSQEGIKDEGLAPAVVDEGKQVVEEKKDEDKDKDKDKKNPDAKKPATKKKDAKPTAVAQLVSTGGAL